MQSIKTVYAILVDHFKLTLEQIGNLTDRQIAEIYFAPRDDTGKVKPQEVPEPIKKPESYAQDLQDLFRLEGVISKENFEECLAKIRQKWSR